MGQACRVTWAEDVAWLLCSPGSRISLIGSFNIPQEPNPYYSSCRYEKQEIQDIFKGKTASVFRFALSIAVVVLAAQSCPTLCNPIDCSLLGPSVHEILQARILEWVATSSSRGSSQPRNQTWVSHIVGRFFTTEPTEKSSTGQIQDIFQW